THTTTHDPTTLASTFASSRPAHFCSPAGPSMRFSTSHVAAMPPNFTDDADLAAFSHTDETIGLVKAGATIMRYVDFAPGTTTAMHRTQSLDFGICLEGTVVAVMDGGEERRLGRGDVVVQRGTMHAWRNAGEGWARMAYVMTASDPVVVGGREL
ncbi:RmlC-like cupin domain-containing protein, partial [Geopyxis carbonaria]